MLTHKQLTTYKFIVQRIADEGRAPTYREIADHAGISSVGTAHSRVKAISQRGLLHQTGNGIELPQRVRAERGAFILLPYKWLPNAWPRLVRVAVP